MSSEHIKLIEDIETGGLRESKAISQILNANRQKIQSFVKRHKGSQAEAEDILIEGVTEMIFNIKKKKFKGTGSINAYLYQICRLLWYQKYRTKKIEDNNETITDAHVSNVATLELSDHSTIIDGVLNQIGSDCKTVLQLWSEGYNMTEIQNKMNYTSSQVAMNKKSKCIKKLIELVNSNPNLKKLLLELI